MVWKFELPTKFGSAMMQSSSDKLGLEEKGLQVPAESTLRALFWLIPAGHAKEIKGLDPVYENQRRAFKDSDEICIDLQSKFSLMEEYE